MRHMKKYFILPMIIIISFFIAEIAMPECTPADSLTPAPTEILQRKKDRKEFKKHRKEFIEQMHKTAPDIDWKQIDAETRSAKHQENTALRSELLNSGDYDHSNPPSVRFLQRDIEGSWNERGSNNLSGRILAAEIDFENELLYCASSGGNIWRGTLEGTDWVSLNDYFQIKGIKLLRFVDTGNNQCCLNYWLHPSCSHSLYR